MKVKGINKTFVGYDGEPNFHLDIPEINISTGHMVYLMGHNGSGKSVALKLMSGEILPSKGKVEFSITDKKWQAHKYPSSVVRQKAEDNLAVELTVRDNILIHNTPTTLLDKIFPRKFSQAKLQTVIKKHKTLASKFDQVCRNLSGGQKQELAFLLASTKGAKVLFLDEFLSATDSRATALMLSMAKEYAQEQNACIIIVSHEIQSALKHADRILILNNGRLAHDLLPGDSHWNDMSLYNLLQ